MVKAFTGRWLHRPDTVVAQQYDLPLEALASD